MSNYIMKLKQIYKELFIRKVIKILGDGGCGWFECKGKNYLISCESADHQNAQYKFLEDCAIDPQFIKKEG